jgi:hypothetical protein
MRLRPAATTNYALVLVSILVAVLVTLIADRSLGYLVRLPHSLVFDAYSVVNYTTSEFHVQARINNLGFRGRDVAVRRERRYRIVTLGDSFTFGWGVDTNDTWPHVLEEALQEHGLDVEVLNLARPGTYSAQYAEIAERAVPLLMPDLVVVAVNHADDLGQTMTARAGAVSNGSSLGVWGAVKLAIRSTYPNVVGLRRALSSRFTAADEATKGWKMEVANYLPRLGADDRAKFDGLDDEIKSRFVKGDLNPGMLAAGLQRPDETQKTLDIDRPEVQDGIQEMSRDLLRIKAVADRTGGRVMVVSLPNGFFVSRLIQESYRRMGYIANDSYLTTTTMDDAVRRSASTAAVAFVTVTRQFREESTQRNLFFQFDGHYNKDGQRFFASCIEPFVSQELVGRR